MTVKHSWWRRGFTLSLAIGALLACGIRQDEFDCENAVAHLQACCPGFSGSSVSCTYNAGDSCGGATFPALDLPTSDCIRQASCQTLVAAGICDRAMRSPLSTSSDTETTQYRICPPGAEVPDASDDTPAQGTTVMIGCTRAADCAGRQVCCVSGVSGTAGFAVTSSCSFAPCSLGFQLCASSPECPQGQQCAPSSLARSLGFSVMACSPPPDTGTDAPADALSDAPEASAPPEAEAEAAADAEAQLDSGADAGLDAGADATDAADVEAAP